MTVLDHPKYTGLVSSFIIHAAVIAVVVLIAYAQRESLQMYGRGGTYQIDMLGGGVSSEVNSVDPLAGDEPKDAAVNPDAAQAQQTEAGGDGGGLLAGADTSGLRGQYVEQTLHVRIRYPAGWSFMDQNRKRKLDGITFLGAPTTSGAIPYVHLDVQEKYIFNPSKYKQKSEQKNYTMYYNDAEVLEGQCTQTIYIRTETDEDYAIKLIVKGEDAFKEFQPLFFGMIKTFRFGEN